MEEILSKITKAIDELKVIDKKEEAISSESNFIALKKGTYKLANNQIIEREGVIKRVGRGDAVCIFAITTDKKILIVIQPRVPLPTKSKVNIELPAGYIEKDEDSITAGKRELEEETGYTSNDLILIDSYYTSLGYSGERIDLVMAFDCIKIGNQKLDEDEFVKYELVSLEEFEYLLNQNFIMDANARIGYYRYLEYLMKEGY